MTISRHTNRHAAPVRDREILLASLATLKAEYGEYPGIVTVLDDYERDLARRNQGELAVLGAYPRGRKPSRSGRQL